MSKWTSDFVVEFVPLPEEMEEAYWAAMEYFAAVLAEEFEAMDENQKSELQIIKQPSSPTEG